MSTEKVADFITGTGYQDLPADIREICGTAVLDHVGVMLGAREDESVVAVARLARALGGRPDATLLDRGDKVPCATAAMVGAIPAGTPFAEEEQVTEYLPVPRGMVSETSPDVYALRVSGNSLLQDGIMSGDFAVIEPGAAVVDGRIYAVRLDNEMVLRRVYRETDCWRLEAGQDYTPIRRQDAEILGRLVLCLRRYA